MPSLSYRNKNPGNIEWSKGGFATKANRKGTKGEKGFAKFPTVIKGLACLADLISTITYSTLTIEEFFFRYAPTKDNNYPEKYAKFVSTFSGIGLKERIAGEKDVYKLLRFMEAIVRMEEWEE